MKKQLFTQAVKTGLASLALIAFTTHGFGMGGNTGRIIPMGKVYMLKDGQTIGSYSSEAPLPENTLLKTQGDCAVKLPDLYLVAVDKSQFAISNADTSRELRVKDGTVYFALSKLPRALVFTTPEGFATAQQVILNASTEKSILKGYVTVSEKGSEIGVIEGGSLLISTADGNKLVKAGNRIYLAQAGPGAILGDAGFYANPWVLAAIIAAAITIPLALSLGVNNDDTPGAGSLAAPQ